MFFVRIFNDKNELISWTDLKHPSPDESTPAEYLTFCIFTFVDLLNGGKVVNENIKFANVDNVKPYGTEEARCLAVATFLKSLNEHPAFDPENWLSPNSANYFFYQEITSILDSTLKDTSTHIYLMDLLSKLKIEGISKIEFTNDFTHNQEVLYRCNFPDDLIPEDFICLLSSQLMDFPCFDKSQPDKFFDREKLRKWINLGKPNPYTRQKMSLKDIEIDEDVQDKIAAFIGKVITTVQNFPKSKDKEFFNRKEDICGPMSSEEFKYKIQKEKEIQSKDKISIQTLINKEQNSNPIELYQKAIELYHNKKFPSAISLLWTAVRSFDSKKAKHSKENFNCISTLISCNREMGLYEEAIRLSEYAILIFLIRYL